MVNQNIEQLLQEAIDQSMAQTQESRELAEEVASTIGDIRKEASDAVKRVDAAIPTAVKDEMTATYYVDANPEVGSDENDGKTKETAFATLSMATNQLISGSYSEIYLAANGYQHVFPALKVPSCSLRISCYEDDSFSEKKLSLKCTGAYPFYPKKGTEFEYFFSGEFDKIFELSTGRFCENPHICSYGVASKEPKYPLIVTLPTDEHIYPFYSSGYSESNGCGVGAMSNVVFCREVTGEAGNYSFTNLKSINFSVLTDRSPLIASFGNVAFHSDSLVNHYGTKIAEGTYVFSRGNDLPVGV